MTSYSQFCPVSTATDVLGPRWAILVVRSLLAGNTRFRDIQRGVPGCPPATLSKRLKELTAAGVVQRASVDDGAYELTEAGMALEPVVEALGRWAHEWGRSSYEGPLEPEPLMWDLRNHLDPSGLGVERAVVQLSIRKLGRSVKQFWMVVEPGEVDVCFVEPDLPVDVVVEAGLLALARIWRRETTFDAAMGCGEVQLLGPPALTGRIPTWLATHPVLSAGLPACDREPAA